MNQNDEIEKSMHINVGHVDLSDFFDWWKNHEEFRHLSRVARNILCVPTINASRERNLV
jgi:hypothetical protein